MCGGHPPCRPAKRRVLLPELYELGEGTTPLANRKSSGYDIMDLLLLIDTESTSVAVEQSEHFVSTVYEVREVAIPDHRYVRTDVEGKRGNVISNELGQERYSL